MNTAELTKDEIRAKIAELEYEAQIMKNFEQAIKIMLNSIYGAFGNKYFYFFNPDIAESITLQGQDAINYARKVIDHYFKNHWHKDHKLHQALGVDTPEPLTDQGVIYMDTDSAYVAFESMIKSCNWKGSRKEFVEAIYDLRFNKLLETAMQNYSKNNNAIENYLNFELETIADTGIWLAKKNYLQNIVWKDGQNFNNKIVIKGWDSIKGSTPPLARRRLTELANFILTSEEFDVDEIVKKAKEVKKEYMIASDIEQICENYRINNLEKYIVDYEGIKPSFNKGASNRVRAAGKYNNMLYHSDYTEKYKYIISGDKCKVYAITTDSKEVEFFAFQAGDHPYEFAPVIDREQMFIRTFLESLNRIFTAVGRDKLTSNLMIRKSLF